MGIHWGGLRLVLIVIVLGGMIFAAGPAEGTQLAGGRGLATIQFPAVLNPGLLNITLHTRSFARSMEGWTLTNGTGAISFNFGFTKRVELGFTQVMYQDLNVSALGPDHMENIPGDTYLRFKVGGFPFTLGKKYFKFGVLNSLRIRTGLVDNIYLEPYVSQGIEWQMDLLFSYYLNPLYEDNAPALHFNLGYLNHNDSGIGESPLDASQELMFALAYVYPTRSFDWYLETSGSSFLVQPEEWAYAREDYVYLTPGFRYKMFYGLNINVGMDVLVWENEDKTNYNLVAPKPAGGPNYPSWRFNGSISISPSTSFYRSPTFQQVGDARSTRRMLRQRKSPFEWVVDDKAGIEYINLELEKIKSERQKAEEELKKIKKELSSN